VVGNPNEALQHHRQRFRWKESKAFAGSMLKMVKNMIGFRLDLKGFKKDAR
jgi:hypothetical protein